MPFYRPEVISLIFFLLPGFLSAWIVYGLTAFQKPSAFERVVQSLIFTMLADTSARVTGWVLLLVGPHFTVGVWNEDARFIWSLFFAALIGLVTAISINNNLIGRLLPKWVTKRTSYPSEWYSAFTRTPQYVFLHLSGDRRLYAWVEEWPDDPTNGFFVLCETAWILPTNEAAPMLNTQRMLVKASDIEMIEFVSDTVVPDGDPDLESSVRIVHDYNKSLTDQDAGELGDKTPRLESKENAPEQVEEKKTD
jgi:hypothetical protein